MRPVWAFRRRFEPFGTALSAASQNGCRRWGWSGRRGSNSRHAAWKAAALPTELLPPDGPKSTSRSSPFPAGQTDALRTMSGTADMSSGTPRASSRRRRRPTESGIALFFLLLAGYALIANRLDQASIGPAVFFVVLGLLLGPDALGLLRLDIESSTVRELAELTLALVLFTDASTVGPARTAARRRPGRPSPRDRAAADDRPRRARRRGSSSRSFRSRPRCSSGPSWRRPTPRSGCPS